MSNDQMVAYCKRFPILTITDLFKFLYQSCFGCEHLVTDYEHAVASIKEEVSLAKQDKISGAEALDGPFCRVHLDVISQGLSPETLAKLFVLSSKRTIGGLSALRGRLDDLLSLSAQGLVPFSESEVLSAIAMWEKEGFSPCRHSGQFRRFYHPSYRVISAEFVRYLPLLSLIDTRLRSGRATVAIDGGCASGKTTLSEVLATVYDCNVFHMDDFFLQPQQRTKERLASPGENADHERFLKEVLIPTAKDQLVEYRRYNCHLGKIEAAIPVSPKQLTIVEGAYSLHSSLVDYYDLKVFLDGTPEEQKRRILERNGPDLAQRFFDEWIPLEARYFSICGVREHADYILPAIQSDGTQLTVP